jgi:hypothetical protein
MVLNILHLSCHIFLCLHITRRWFFSGKIAGWTDDELDATAEAIGLGAVK